MKIVSMAYTSPAVAAGKKCVTRRNWKESYAKTFHKGDSLEAWTRSPRNGGRPLALIRLTAEPVSEPVGIKRQEDGYAELEAKEVIRIWNEEGFAYLDTPEGDLLEAARRWHDSQRGYWTIMFEILQVTDSSIDTPEERERCRDALLRFIDEEVQR